MSSIEERLARDIAATTGGVVMTGSELTEARAQVEDRLESRTQRDRRRTLAVAAAAAVAIPILGFAAFQTQGENDSAPPANPGPSLDSDTAFLTGRAPSMELLEGVWRVDNGFTLLRFRTDGTVFFTSAGKVYSDPVVGNYTLDGDLITIDVQTSPSGCTAGENFTMRASQPETGVLHVAHTKPVTGTCLSDQDDRWVLEQVLPTNGKELVGLDFSGAVFQPLPKLSSLHGDWMAQGGGHILEITPEAGAAPNGGLYSVAGSSGEVVDHGRWTVDASRSQLSLVSSANSQACDEGDRLVLGELAHADPGRGTSAFRATVEQNTCGAPWTPVAWILLPHLTN